MKKKMIAGIAAGSLVALLSAPIAASAAPRDYTTDPHTRTNGSVTNPFGKTNGDTTDPFTSTNGDTTNPHGRTN
jgi:ABC-type oligopeptide transport system substrate-binding subunit